MVTNLNDLCIEQHRTVEEAIRQIDRTRLGIVLVVDDEKKLAGTVTDGDVRRAILSNFDFRQSVQLLIKRKSGTPHAKPVTARIGQQPSAYMNLLKRHRLVHLPILDDEDRVVGLVTSNELLKEESLGLSAVVMAGGAGSRLSPLTDQVPKPMLPVGDKPILEIIIRQLKEAGIRKVKVTTHHKSEMITRHFQDGSAFGVELSYVSEAAPLGTVGGLGLMEAPQETTLVMNGDILTQVDIRAMLLYHREHQADLTMAVRRVELKVPYGVVECEGAFVRQVSEKPSVGLFVNAGIYLLEPVTYPFIPAGERFDMTDLIQCLLHNGRKVASFPIREYWLDIGQPSDYSQAQEEIRSWGGSP